MDFRIYDNAIGRFYGMDALSEKNHYLSPFQFGNGNPVFWADPSGLDSSMPGWMQEMWNKSGSGVTTWTNIGGAFESNNGDIVQYISIDAGGSSGGGGGAAAGGAVGSGAETGGIIVEQILDNYWIVSYFSHKFVPTNLAKNKGQDIITLNEYHYNKDGTFMISTSYLVIENGEILESSTTVTIKNKEGEFETHKTENFSYGIEEYGKAIIDWFKKDGSSPLQMLATENREWNATEGKIQNRYRNAAKSVLAVAAIDIPIIGPAVSGAIRKIDVNQYKPEHADLIFKIKSKSLKIN